MGDLSAHFSRSEFMCKCGSCDSLGDVNPELIQVLERLRAMCLGKPIKINSGHRCVTYNGKVGGSPNSQHILGNAADDIHIDHIIPLSSFDLSDDDELKRAWCLTNLRPAWADDNRKKSDKILFLL